MIDQEPSESRVKYLMRVAALFILEHGESTIEYDDTTCDGYCLSEEIIIAIDSLD